MIVESFTPERGKYRGSRWRHATAMYRAHRGYLLRRGRTRHLSLTLFRRPRWPPNHGMSSALACAALVELHGGRVLQP
jgi:hypothetical protein